MLFNKRGRLDYRNQLISYAAWPRPVVLQGSEQELEEIRHDILDAHKYSALILNDVQLKLSLPNAKRLHSEIEFIRLP